MVSEVSQVLSDHVCVKYTGPFFEKVTIVQVVATPLNKIPNHNGLETYTCIYLNLDIPKPHMCTLLLKRKF